jgi:hypothetical protein
MLQFLSIETYNSPGLLVVFTLTPRENDVEYPLYIHHIDDDDDRWEIKAVGSTLTCESRFSSSTIKYDHPIAYLRMGVFALRVILDDGSYRFKILSEDNTDVTQVYSIDELNCLCEETLSVLAELKDERMLKLSQVTERRWELLEQVLRHLQFLRQ